ncbi:predicted metal-dependent hydrolase with the TIM-barrel fold [Anaerolinea thermolimosa]|uniref:Predicted metal-dependent hydrolase with the TIM-barrel fold n=1 Tax=Anaerolinea thermolimosa TaxID=229919 RepID=A0A7U9PT37_9CHLR|nr:esterase [Anaerolinea thermolimosa]GAP08387.1 predicted metal-dependent hydrolase with the TIM-barrel fold [Anaerolinea thermolimosa]
MSVLYTTFGALDASRVGMILPHEHIFVDLRTLDAPGHGQARIDNVLALMVPQLARARSLGVSVLVECTPEGVGRRVDLVKAVSLAAGLPVVVATGIYREPWVPDWARTAPEDILQGWMLGELEVGIGQTGVRAGFIKVSAGDEGLTEIEKKILRAAGRAGAASGAAIGSHTIRGRVVHDQLDILERCGFDPHRFISIHAQAEADFSLNLEVARRGAWISYDGIGWGDDDDRTIRRILDLLDAGFGDQILLSMDRGWYDPAHPGGENIQPYDYLSEIFLPKLRAAGADPGTIHALTVDNPFRAFSR